MLGIVNVGVLTGVDDELGCGLTLVGVGLGEGLVGVGLGEGLDGVVLAGGVLDADAEVIEALDGTDDAVPG